MAIAAGLAEFAQENGDSEKMTILESIGAGVAFVDYDADGWFDAYLTNGSSFEDRPSELIARDAMYRNERGAFRDVTADLGLGDEHWTAGVRAADIDGDGWTDLYLTNWGANVFYRNDAGERFVDATAATGIGDERWSTGSCFLDHDLDGDLDLYVVNYVVFDAEHPPEAKHEYRGVRVYFGPRGLPGARDTFYRNEGDGSFVDATESVGVAASGGYGFQAVVLDYDQDGLPDIFVGNDSTPNYLWRNDGKGGFQDRGIESGVAFSNAGMEQAGMGVAVGDSNGDQRLDLYVTNFSEDYNTVYQNQGSGFLSDATLQSGLLMTSIHELGWGCTFADLDNDGDQDLLAANGHVWPQVDQFDFGSRYRQRNQLFLNLGDGTYVEATDQAGPGFQIEESSRGLACGDFDNDGDVDVLIGNLDAPPTLLRNETPRTGNWLLVRLVGTSPNRDAVGATIALRSGDTAQFRPVGESSSFLSTNDPRVHFGLGSAINVDEITVTWPNQDVQTFRDVPANRLITIRQGVEEIETVEQ